MVTPNAMYQPKLIFLPQPFHRHDGKKTPLVSGTYFIPILAWIKIRLSQAGNNQPQINHSRTKAGVMEYFLAGNGRSLPATNYLWLAISLTTGLAPN